MISILVRIDTLPSTRVVDHGTYFQTCEKNCCRRRSSICKVSASLFGRIEATWQDPVAWIPSPEHPQFSQLNSFCVPCRRFSTGAQHIPAELTRRFTRPAFGAKQTGSCCQGAEQGGRPLPTSISSCVRHMCHVLVMNQVSISSGLGVFFYVFLWCLSSV